jgi:predicted lactoylglutathione lyase
MAYGNGDLTFWIDIFHPHGVKQHTAFRARDRQQVDAFHEAALVAGGIDNGRPGSPSGGYYAAFIRNPDGNSMEAVFREA